MAIISANLALEQGRELMCIPGLITNPNTEGIYKLLKNLQLWQQTFFLQ